MYCATFTLCITCYLTGFQPFVTLWTQQKFQARVAEPAAQGAPAATFRTPGWAGTCLIKIAYPNDLNYSKITRTTSKSQYTH